MKRNVIEEYLEGTSRDENASKNGLSEGGVTNIISEWKVGLSQPTADDDIRELAVSLRKLGITAPECASGLGVVDAEKAWCSRGKFSLVYLRDL